MGGIALRTSNDAGDYFFMNLYMGRKVHSNQFHRLLITDDVINRVQNMAKEEGQPIMTDGPLFEYSGIDLDSCKEEADTNIVNKHKPVDKEEVPSNEEENEAEMTETAIEHTDGKEGNTQKTQELLDNIPINDMEQEANTVGMEPDLEKESDNNVLDTSEEEVVQECEPEENDMTHVEEETTSNSQSNEPDEIRYNLRSGRTRT
eukprot:CAMPEP_0184859912 /NCGR_PEP_ID=MMETSP0580-20130426/4875_1 /TAXON_ID=1118495 /ORGANISM="Dactyliosolen fragilissimus" /LENGTH=203 /DNA_ID=CAMNT_0027356793 /DNA_START=1055 /DNA_END=1666 /DNA_ORIENTATION=+